MSDLKWTKEPPTKEGWYWRRWSGSSSGPIVAHVVTDYGLYMPGTNTPEEFLAVWLSSSGAYAPEMHKYRILKNEPVEWAGPLEPPA